MTMTEERKGLRYYFLSSEEVGNHHVEEREDVRRNVSPGAILSREKKQAGDALERRRLSYLISRPGGDE